MHLKDWKARRAGATITVNGTGEDGKPAKITGVEYIQPRALNGVAGIYAVCRNGDFHRLANAA